MIIGLQGRIDSGQGKQGAASIPAAQQKNGGSAAEHYGPMRPPLAAQLQGGCVGEGAPGVGAACRSLYVFTWVHGRAFQSSGTQQWPQAIREGSM